MDTITLGQISVAIGFFVALIGGVKYILTDMRKLINKALEPTNKKIDELDEKLMSEIKSTDMDSTKNFLVAQINNAKRGDMDEISKQRMFEQYEHYLKCGGNSYIKNEVDKLKKEGRI